VNLSVSGTTTLSGLTASTALALNASKEIVSVINTGTGSNVLATSPSIATPTLTGDVQMSTGNLVVATSGKGIDFSATPGTGTSELFADYEEGTWTPTDQSGAGLTFTSVTATYTKVGRVVTCLFGLTYPTTVTVNQVVIGGFPFTNTGTGPLGGGVINYTDAAITNAYFSLATSSTLLYAYTSGATALANSTLSAKLLRGTVTYMV
jgi:hypothetical protein